MFRTVCYRPDECQIITSGTDRKIGYWEVYDGSQIRELDGSMSDSINGMDIHGKFFVTGGGDKLIKVQARAYGEGGCMEREGVWRGRAYGEGGRMEREGVWRGHAARATSKFKAWTDECA